MSNVTFLNQAQTKGAKFNANSSSVPVLPSLDAARSQSQTDKDLNKVLVITKNDLNRITGHLNRRQEEQDNLLEELNRKKELHERSLALTCKWNNTIEGARKKKLQQNKMRKDKEEEEKRQVDLEHAQMMADERRKNLEQARLVQYYETDKVKKFHSGLRLTEVLKERDAQVEMKKLINETNKNQEYEERHEIDKEYKAFLHNEIENGIKKQMERSKLADYHKTQINKHIEDRLKLKEQERLENEALKKLNEQHRFEKEMLDEHEKQRIRELKKIYDRTIETKKILNEAEKAMNEDENDDIRAYAAAKHKMALLRREKENHLWKEKQEKKEQIIAYLGLILKQQEEDEGFRIAKAADQLQKKQQHEHLEKIRKTKETYEEIRKHREETIKEKQHQKELNRLETENEMKKKMEADYLYQVYEDEKWKQKQQQFAKISKENFKELNEKKVLEKLARQEEKDFIMQETKLLEMEDKQFEDYANRVLDYMERHGRNVIPMRKVLNDHLKSLRKIDINNDASEIKKHQVEISTAKNLGFIALKPKIAK